MGPVQGTSELVAPAGSGETDRVEPAPGAPFLAVLAAALAAPATAPRTIPPSLAPGTAPDGGEGDAVEGETSFSVVETATGDFATGDAPISGADEVDQSERASTSAPESTDLETDAPAVATRSEHFAPQSAAAPSGHGTSSAQDRAPGPDADRANLQASGAKDELAHRGDATPGTVRESGDAESESPGSAAPAPADPSATLATLFAGAHAALRLSSPAEPAGTTEPDAESDAAVGPGGHGPHQTAAMPTMSRRERSRASSAPSAPTADAPARADRATTLADLVRATGLPSARGGTAAEAPAVSPGHASASATTDEPDAALEGPRGEPSADLMRRIAESVERDAERNGKTTSRLRTAVASPMDDSAREHRADGASQFVAGGQPAAADRVTIRDASPGEPAPTARPVAPDTPPARVGDRVTLPLPDELGGGRLHVAVRGDVVRARIVTPDAAVARAVTEDVAELERSLGRQGFREVHVSVDAAPVPEGQPAAAAAADRAAESRHPETGAREQRAWREREPRERPEEQAGRSGGRDQREQRSQQHARRERER